MNYLLNKQGHILYEDGVKLPYDNDLMNYAEDYVINDQLITAKIGKMPAGGLHWPTLITGDMAVLDAYRLLYKVRQQQGGGKPGQKPGQGGSNSGGTSGDESVMRTTKDGQTHGPGSGKPWGQTLKPGEGRGVDVNKAMSQRNQPEWDVSVQAAMESAKLRGQLPDNLERLFRKRLEPKADWRDLFTIAVSKRIGNDRYTWANLNQQLAYRRIGCPGRTSHGCDLVVVIRDSSGSIDDHTCAVFGAETRGILEQARPKRVILIDCDAKVHRYDEIEDLSELENAPDKYEKVKGGGGTSFKPPFERLKAESEEPDVVIYLTDCYGDYGKKPSYPVIWGSITPKAEMNLAGYDYTPPWGDIIYVPKQAESNSEGDF
jgi:VWA-like domain (DUF2201)/Putative metallopeptidase domain